MIADQDIRKSVLDVRKSFIVQAPAGSGKTTLLVQRFLHLLLDVERDPEEILAITFTRKAAAEMRARVLDALDNIDDPLVQKINARDQLLGWDLQHNPARLKIHTIDALCASVAGRLPILSRFGAAPQIADQPNVLYAQAVAQLLQQEEQELSNLLLYLDNDRIKVTKLLINMLQVRDQWLPFLLRDDLSEVLASSLQLLQSEIVSDLEANIPKDFEPLIFIENMPVEYVDWLPLAKVLLTSSGMWRKRLTKSEGFPAPSSSKNKEERAEWSARKEAAMAALEKLQAATKFRQQLHLLQILGASEYTGGQLKIIVSLAAVLRLLVAELVIVFKDLGQVDYTEVTLAALRSLGQYEYFSRSVDYKLRHILVDEFQDTSISQFTLLELLVSNWDPASTSVFLVGDPMQSIYRFREAEVGLFIKAKESGIGGVKLSFVQLQVNFRSQPEVVSWINHTFAASFPQQDDMVLGAISYQESVAAQPSSSDKDGVQCINTFTEAAAIVNIIKDTPKDKSIAILVRSRSHLADILPMLRKHNIAYQGTDLETLAERSIAQDLSALTSALLHLDNRIAWLAVLRAPWLGLTLQQLLHLAEYDGTIWQAVQQLQLEPFCTIMRGALSAVRRMPIDQLVKNTWHNLGGEECVRDKDELSAVQAYFKFLANNAQRPELMRPDFINSELANIFLQPQTLDASAVQIMTMHKAKGLEFDVVIVPKLAKQPRANEAKLMLLERRDFVHDYLLLAPLRANNTEHNNMYDYLMWCEKQRQQHEMLRLFYVAATRAKGKLYCMADVVDGPPASGSLLSAVWDKLSSQFVTVDAETQVLDNSRQLYRLSQGTLQNREYKQNISPVVSRKQLVFYDDWQRIVGTVVHRALWHIACYGHKNMPDWSRYAAQLGLADRYHKYIDTALQNALACEKGSWILSSQHNKSFAEWPLSINHNGEAKQLVIDRAFLTADDVLWIIDYKLVFNANISQSTYESQLKTYQRALQQLYPQQEIKLGLYFPLQQEFIQLT